MELIQLMQANQQLAFHNGQRDGYLTAWQQVVAWSRTQPAEIRGPVLDLCAQAMQQGVL
jgi:hypothetical protein